LTIDDEERIRIPALQESIDIRRREVETGRVRIRKEVHSRVVQVDAPVVRERVVVERVAVDREVDRDAPPTVREESRVVQDVPLAEERVVVERVDPDVDPRSDRSQ
jgi:uncharacterized protein (TIGR02271 family)